MGGGGGGGMASRQTEKTLVFWTAFSLHRILGRTVQGKKTKELLMLVMPVKDNEY